eukprot:gnl/TRDRNA2_/TRDRNA2_159719_c0_seq1.p1 gnl/TRDRNA2_/TRDRNA2_159719_c0~~gnl/TRDRNA2_/TRDRNA2_159719_c0_seq1.p1  ORF type:complete len:559 (+),score=82.19 gnl/TRDRNA2_/TRDRNA2_159719_c0_seq1:133-1677(+)
MAWVAVLLAVVLDKLIACHDADGQEGPERLLRSDVCDTDGAPQDLVWACRARVALAPGEDGFSNHELKQLIEEGLKFVGDAGPVGSEPRGGLGLPRRLGSLKAWDVCSLAHSYQIGMSLGTMILYLQVAIVVVPVLSGVIVTIASRFQFKEKWAQVKTASAELVRQIYLFRAAVGPYSPTNILGQDTEEENEEAPGEELSPAAKAKLCRMRFVKRVNDVFQKTMNVSLSDDFLQQGPLTKSGRLSPETLREYVLQALYEESASNTGLLRSWCKVLYRCCCCCTSRRQEKPKRERSIAAAQGLLDEETADGSREVGNHDDRNSEVETLVSMTDVADTWDPDDPLDGMDDCISSLTAETYYQSRMLRLMTRFQRDSPGLAAQQDGADIAVFICGFMASLLGAFHTSSWIPVILGFSGMLTTIMTYKGSRSQLHASNFALAELTALNVQWHALSNVDRRTPRFKAMIVEKTEWAAFSVVQAWAGSTAFTALGVQEEGDKTKKDSKHEKGKAEKKDGS